MSITKDENAKIRHLLSSIESTNGVVIPFTTGRKIFEVYSELTEYLKREAVV